MVTITFDLTKSIEENASLHYDTVKKLKGKLKGAKETIELQKKKLKKLERKEEERVSETVPKIVRKKEWFEKFRWFYSSEGFLCIGGRDATTNEIVVKKHTEEGDLIFHTDMAGSPFFIVKSGKKQPGEQTIREAADATVTFSKAWGLGLTRTEVFYASPDQVTKQAEAGEFLAKGSFMIRGKTTYVDNQVNCAVGSYDGTVMAGPMDAIRTHCDTVLVVKQGNDKASDAAKKIKRTIGGEIDDIIRALPSGKFTIRS